jgi:hypothetical protein
VDVVVDANAVAVVFVYVDVDVNVNVDVNVDVPVPSAYSRIFARTRSIRLRTTSLFGAIFSAFSYALWASAKRSSLK